MSSRMNKYYEEPENIMSRTNKNQDLYKDISKSELENYSIRSNATVLGDNKNEIDVEKIKKILDTKYNELPKRKSIKIEEEPETVIEREDTKEYDIKAILEKAKVEKVVSYEEERLKKLRDTQFDILSNLDINKDNDEKEEINQNDNLRELINTIAFNEKNNNSDNFDILSDLKGDDDTEVFTAMKELEEDSISEKEVLEISEKNEIIEDKTMTSKELEQSFYTKSNLLVNKDFEDVEEGMSIFVKIIIAIVIIAFLVGVGLLIKSIFF